MVEAKKQIFWNNGSLKARFLKLQVIAMVDAIDEDDQYARTNMQMSKLEFVDVDGNIFSWPANFTISISSFVIQYEPIANILKQDFSKGCINYQSKLPFEITIDIGEGQSIDFKKWCFYRWWTADDTQKFPSRNIRTWKLFASNNDKTYICLDEVVDFNPPALNNTLAYTSKEFKL